MPTPAQAAAATVGAGSLAAAGAYGITQAVNGSGEEVEEQTTEETPTNEMPTGVSVFSNSEDFSGTNYNTKLISLIKTSNLPHLVKPENNDKWWDWAFKNKYQTKTPETKLDALFDNLNDLSGLKNACESAYKADKNKYAFGDQDYLLKNISDYCTKGETTFDISEPKAQVYQNKNTTTGYTTGVTSIAENALVLVKKDAETTNDLWWKWAFKTLYKATEHASDDNFKEITTGFDGSSGSSARSLHKQCDEAYKKPYSELTKTNNSLLIKIKKLCSTDRSETLLKLPEPVLQESDLLPNTESNYTSHVLVTSNDKVLVDPKKAQDWWKWTFENVFSPFKSENSTKLKTPFNDSKITAGYSEVTNISTVGDITSLNKACLEAYKKTKDDLGGITTGNDNLIDLVKNFCVPSTKTSTLKKPS